MINEDLEPDLEYPNEKTIGALPFIYTLHSRDQLLCSAGTGRTSGFVRLIYEDRGGPLANTDSDKGPCEMPCERSSFVSTDVSSAAAQLKAHGCTGDDKIISKPVPQIEDAPIIEAAFLRVTRHALPRASMLPPPKESQLSSCAVPLRGPQPPRRQGQLPRQEAHVARKSTLNTPLGSKRSTGSRWPSCRRITRVAQSNVHSAPPRVSLGALDGQACITPHCLPAPDLLTSCSRAEHLRRSIRPPDLDEREERKESARHAAMLDRPPKMYRSRLNRKGSLRDLFSHGYLDQLALNKFLPGPFPVARAMPSGILQPKRPNARRSSWKAGRLYPTHPK